MKVVKESDWMFSENKAGLKKFWKLLILQSGKSYYTQSKWYQITKTGNESAVQESTPYEAKPTNVGRANERDSAAQAEFEFDSIIKKQKDKGFRFPGEKKTVRPLPMLAHKYTDHWKKISWPAIVQPKLDGMRMLFDGTTGWSRGNKEIIPECIAHIKANTKGYILDGELILPGNVPLQDTMSAAKKYRPGISDTLEYIVYDIVDETMPYDERLKILNSIVSTSKNIKLITSVIIQTPHDAYGEHKKFTKMGYEGIMVRNTKSMYTIGKRSYDLLKFKEFLDSEFKIIDVAEGSGSDVGLAILVCEIDGTTFNARPEGSQENRAEIFNDRKNVIGKYATVRYQTLTKDGVPQFPVAVGIREWGEF